MVVARAGYLREKALVNDYWMKQRGPVFYENFKEKPGKVMIIANIKKSCVLSPKVRRMGPSVCRPLFFTRVNLLYLSSSFFLQTLTTALTTHVRTAGPV